VPISKKVRRLELSASQLNSLSIVAIVFLLLHFTTSFVGHSLDLISRGHRLPEFMNNMRSDISASTSFSCYSALASFGDFGNGINMFAVIILSVGIGFVVAAMTIVGLQLRVMTTPTPERLVAIRWRSFFPRMFFSLLAGWFLYRAVRIVCILGQFAVNGL
jgi:hypothetical protein